MTHKFNVLTQNIHTLRLSVGGHMHGQTHSRTHRKYLLNIQGQALAPRGAHIGSFPQEIQFTNKDGEIVTRKIDYHELTDILKAMSAPVRPYGAVFAFFGGAHQSIRGNYQYF
jgi:hypothetical protein